MKLTFILLFITTTLIAIQLTTASPVQVAQTFSDNNSKTITDAAVPKNNELIGRQQTVAAPAPVAAVEEDDDDDDDDDDDIEDAFVDDGRQKIYLIFHNFQSFFHFFHQICPRLSFYLLPFSSFKFFTSLWVHINEFYALLV